MIPGKQPPVSDEEMQILMRDKLPPDYIMRQMARLANEQAMQMMAAEARKFAADPRMKSVPGDQALLAFAEAILSTNAKVWPKEGGQ